MGKRIAIVGAGALGSYVGGYFAKQGKDVTLIDMWPEHIEAIRAHGLRLYGMTPEETHVVTEAKTMHLTELQSLAKQKPIDIAFIAVKSYDTEWASLMIRQYLAADGFAVSLQNSINEEKIAGIMGWGRTVGAVASSISVNLYQAGNVRRTVQKGGSHHTIFRVGELHGRVTKRVEELVEMFSFIDSAKTTTNLWGERWTKLIVNCMANGISAASGLSNPEAEEIAEIRRLSILLGGEAVRVGQALGYVLEDVGHMDPERLALASEGDAAAFEEMDALKRGRSNAGQRSDMDRPSMGQDMLKGRRTEIGFLNGLVVSRAAEIGRAAPANARLVDIVTRVERGELPASPNNLL